MKSSYLITIVAVLLSSCSHKKSISQRFDTVKIKQQVRAVQIKEDTLPLTVDTSKRLLNYNFTHIFSDPSNKDSFNISLFGKSIIAGVIVFEIDDFKHKKLFKDTFPATDLLGDQANILNAAQQKDTIKARMTQFLDNKNFESPAIGDKETVEEAFEEPDKSDIANWKAVKKDPQSVRFIYGHGYEGVYGIAFSKKKKKVVTIFYSD
jgi:hypothetical protein